MYIYGHEFYQYFACSFPGGTHRTVSVGTMLMQNRVCLTDKFLWLPMIPHHFYWGNSKWFKFAAQSWIVNDESISDVINTKKWRCHCHGNACLAWHCICLPLARDCGPQFYMRHCLHTVGLILYWIPRCRDYCSIYLKDAHSDVMTLKPFPHYCPFLRGIHRAPVVSHHTVPERWCLFLVTWTSCWTNIWAERIGVPLRSCEVSLMIHVDDIGLI